MPSRAAKACAKPGCGALTSGHWCEAHARQAEQVRREGRAGGFKYDHRWRKRRAAWLTANPLCVSCEARGIIKQASDVDHVVPLSAGGVDDESNYQSLCHDCHSAKTALEDGGFGRRRADRGVEILGDRASLTVEQPQTRGRKMEGGGGSVGVIREDVD